MVIVFLPILSSSLQGSTSILSSKTKDVIAIGKSLTGSGKSSPTSNLSAGTVVFSRALIAARAEASIRLPSSSSAQMSMNIIQTFSPSSMQSLLKSTASLCLIPLSTTLASSIAFSSGGPGSKVGDAKGTNSALVIIMP